MSTVITDEQAIKNLSQNLRRMLADREMSQAELARETGDSEMNVSRYVRGAVMPGAGALARLAEALHVPTDHLLSDRVSKKVG
jgi:transcriptional regulator with XRE-family HTH domain